MCQDSDNALALRLNPASPDGAVSAPLDRSLTLAIEGAAAPKRRSRFGAVAQLVERLLCKEEVRSSSLLGSTRARSARAGARSRSVPTTPLEGAKRLTGRSRMDAGARRWHH